MTMTTKLYWGDSHLSEFSASVIDCFEQDGQSVVVLDQTAFYPLGGGQPCDMGMIGSARVNAVSINDDGMIFHHLDSDIKFKKGDLVNCKIDWAHRLEMTQQHTGQHILSQAFFQLFGAETRGFRINQNYSEIDLALELQPEEIPAAIQQAEAFANSIVFENREIRTHIVTPDEAAKFPLRKENFITDCVRVAEIADFDWSACGGTHARRTGEVGLLTIKSWERAKKMTRIQFVGGIRALQDYRAANNIAHAIARKFSVARDDAPDAVNRLFDEHKIFAQQIKTLSEITLKIEAQELLQSGEIVNGIKIIARIFEQRNLDELKIIAHKLVEMPSLIALLASREAGMARLVFARSANLDLAMGALMREACQRIEGKGGGTADFAQGGGTNVSKLENMMAEMIAKTKEAR